MKKVYTGIFVFLVVLSIIPFHLAPDNFLADDAYFYPQIARQIIQGHGSTFHQITFTNGYHLLWLLVMLPAARISFHHPLLFLNILGAVQVIFYGACLYLVYLLSQKMHLRFYSAAVLILTLVLLNVGGLRLFEAHLSIALQAAALYMLYLILTENKKGYFLLGYGILLGLLLLARSDNIFFVSVLWSAAMLGVIRSNLSKISSTILITLPPLIAGTLFLAYNFLYFDHLTPISGAIKSTFPNAHFSLEALGTHGKTAVIAAMILLTAAIFMKMRKKSAEAAIYLLMWIAVAAHAGYIALYSWGSQWYFTTAYLAIALAMMGILTYFNEFLENRNASFSKFFSNTVCFSLAGLFCITVAVSYLKTFNDFSIVLALEGKQSISHSRVMNPGKEAAAILNKALKPNDGVFVLDAPGILAYYTMLRILPADGLVNDYAYNEEIISKGIQGYLKEKKVEYIFGPYLEQHQSFGSATLQFASEGDHQIAHVYAPLTGLSAGAIQLDDRDIITKVPTPLRNHSAVEYVPMWALWKIMEK